MRFTNKEKIANSINWSTAHNYRNNPVPFKNIALLQFAENNKLLLFKQAVFDGADYNYVYHEWGRFSNVTPLLVAAFNDCVSIVAYIIELAKQKEEFKEVLNFKNDQQFSAFSLAYFLGSLDVLNFLFKHHKNDIEDLNTYKDLSARHNIGSFNVEKILKNRLEFDNNILNLSNMDQS